MDEEIRKGSAGRIIMKMNSVTDMDFIRESGGGVENRCESRLDRPGICCILPGIPWRPRI